jgi:hypothetical protein
MPAWRQAKVRQSTVQNLVWIVDFAVTYQVDAVSGHVTSLPSAKLVN